MYYHQHQHSMIDTKYSSQFYPWHDMFWLKMFPVKMIHLYVRNVRNNVLINNIFINILQNHLQSPWTECGGKLITINTYI